MDILVLQGPNLNLIGVQSAKVGERVTLDKMNKCLRQHANSISLEIQLRFLQTHKAEKAVSFIQRNRKKTQGIIFAPTSWGQYEYSILDALKLLMPCENVPVPKRALLLPNAPCVQVLFDNNYGSLAKNDSIFSPVCIDTSEGHPMTVFNSALDALLKHLS